MTRTLRILATASILTTLGAAQAQSGNVTLYGVIDEYANYMHSSSGTTIKSLEDGAWLRSRFGAKGVEDLGGGLSARFQVEGGFSADTGGQADSSRFWDRQAWVGLASKDFGEVRVGRQNGPVFSRGGNIDYTARTLGSMINNFGVPSRYDNDVSYLSPRISGLQVEAHVALPEAPTGNRALVYQWALDWANDSYRLGYMGVRGRPQAGATVDKDVVYDNLYANWMYGKGTVYLAYVRSNNNTSTAVSNNAGTLLGNVGGFNAGSNADLNNFYDIVQVSADYRVNSQLRVGALWGRINDQSGRGRNASGGSVGAYYDLSKRTMLVALLDTLRNDANGGWRPVGSAGLKTTFTTPGDINGRTINGLQLGIVHRF
ncbi:porin [Roseateles sp. BYS78W]|uniref:Porin n=1 Tax=Pelomonas candidula TaxID=3299025 RepID=A0ABW7HKP3_9BURK